MYSPAFTRALNETLSQGIDYLLQRQSKDGFWRDYLLTPGMSESWSTAWVGWSLAQCGRSKSISEALCKAALALKLCCRENGWGYNRDTVPDADSTAWVLRFLDIMQHHYGLAAVGRLEAWLDAHGRAHTRLDARSGSWGGAHSDVTPVVGLALLSAKAPISLLRRVGSAVITGRAPNGVWRSFWWTTDAYATAWSIEFLAKIGSLSPQVSNDTERWLRKCDADANAFELSHRLLALAALGLSYNELTLALVENLLELSMLRDGWPPAAVLRIPPKKRVSAHPELLYKDEQGLMTTAIACAVLARWIRASGRLRSP
jgi:hypothetical protein